MHEALPQVLLALVAVLVVGQLLARLLVRFGQAPVIGEVLAGILLGPTLLGQELSQRILPESAAPYLAIIAQLGVTLYMFLVGLELNPALVRSHARPAALISPAGILVPLALGALLGWWLHPRAELAGTTRGTFALFMGVALAITAFPVLARILSDRGLEKSQMGSLALACAAAEDIAAWCLLALVVGVVKSQSTSLMVMLPLAAAFVAVMFVLVRPLAVHAVRYHERVPWSNLSLAAVLAAALASAWVTEQIGIGALFGAFLLGVVIPHDSRVAQQVEPRLQAVVATLLLPAFFAYTGMRTRINLVSGIGDWLTCGLIILVATVGKFGGVAAAARMSGLDWRTSAALGALMNTRGLLELVVLNIGLELGVISPRLHAMMVVMALVTTLATAPVLAWLKPQWKGSRADLNVA